MLIKFLYLNSELVRIFANFLYGFINLIATLFFFKYLFNFIGIQGAESYIISVSMMSLVALPINILPIELTRILFNKDKLPQFFNVLIFYSIFMLFISGIFLNFKENYFFIAAFIPMLQVTANCYIVLIDHENAQYKKMISSLVAIIFFGIFLSFNPIYAYLLFLLVRTCMLKILSKTIISKTSFSYMLFASSQSLSENMSKLFLALISPQGSVLIYELICKNLFIARGLVGSALAPYIFRYFDSGKLKTINNYYYLIQIISAFAYIIFSMILIWYYDLDKINLFQIFFICLAFIFNQLGSIVYSEILRDKRYLLLSFLTFIIGLSFITFTILGLEVIAAYSLAIIIHTMLIYFFRGTHDKNFRAF